VLNRIQFEQHHRKLQSKLAAIAKVYSHSVIGGVIVYDFMYRKSFDGLGAWLNDVHALCDASTAIQLICSKADVNPMRVVTVQEGDFRQAAHP
jgi:Ras-related protein Rab-11A